MATLGPGTKRVVWISQAMCKHDRRLADFVRACTVDAKSQWGIAPTLEHWGQHAHNAMRSNNVSMGIALVTDGEVVSRKDIGHIFGAQQLF